METIYRITPFLLVLLLFVFVNDDSALSTNMQIAAFGIAFLISVICIYQLFKTGKIQRVRLVVFAAFLLLSVGISAYHTLKG